MGDEDKTMYLKHAYTTIFFVKVKNNNNVNNILQFEGVTLSETPVLLLLKQVQMSVVV